MEENILHNKKTDLEDRIRFEMLLTDLSARFVNLPDHELDGVIKESQRSICDCLNLDVSTLWQIDEERSGAMFLTHYHLPPGSPPVPTVMNAKEVVPWSYNRLNTGVTMIPRTDDAPAGSERDQEQWRRYGIKSVLTLPLSAGGGEPFGALSFSTIREYQDWPPDLVSRLQVVARIFSSTLARRKSGFLLRESQERLALAASAAGAGFWALNTSRTGFWISSQIAGFFGLPPGDRLDLEAFFSLVHADDRERVQEAVEMAQSRPELSEVEYRIIQPGGQVRWMKTCGRPWAVAGGEVRLTGITVDITDRKQMEFDANELREELAHVSRVSMLGELAVSMAHELNQPLAAILGNAQAARRFLASPGFDLGEIRDILDDIVRDDKRAGEVIHRLRALVQKRAAPDPEALCFNDVVQETEPLLRSELIARNTALETELDPDLPPVFAGRIEMQQILLNLTVNAMDAMKDNPSGRRRIRIRTDCADGWVCLTVQDSGPGLTPEAFSEIFRPFFTTKAQGLGMGLPISRSMVAAYGGRLLAENHSDGGALFRIALPRIKTESS